MITVPFNPPPLLCITLDTKACRSSTASRPKRRQVTSSDFSEESDTWQPPRTSSGISSKEILPKCKTPATNEYISNLFLSLKPKRVKALSSK